MNRTALQRRLAPLALIAALCGTLAACSDDTSGSAGDASSAAADSRAHNDADVAFATQMIPHHQQALEMVDLAADRDLPADVRTLVTGIESAQAPEIDTMTGWLNAWGEPAPSDAGHMGHDMGDMGDDTGDMGDDMGDMSGMPGMMSGQQMTALADAPDARFADMWLRLMIAHHEGAVTMARTELAEGEYPPAIALAQSIVDSQTAEIERMRELLG